jgi:translation initiation factor 2B subunit (eIF-2B alpha/beta/delta family)
LKDLSQRIARIREDHEHGSRWLVSQTILLLRDLAGQTDSSVAAEMQRLRQAGRELAHVRPAMAALAGAVGHILAAPGGPAGMALAAEQLLQVYEQVPSLITSFARPYLQGTILTHSLSGTVLEVLNACFSSIQRVIVLEGRPLYEGRTVVQTLHEKFADLTLITDAQADIFLPICQAVVVGADSILADGSILNKAGTALLAWAAQGHAIPLYVLAETLKISPHPWSGQSVLLEEKSSQEVWTPSVPNIAVRNFYFDHTPAALITQIITEQGPLKIEEIKQRAAQLLQIREVV